jgi:hypothetical protein
MHGSGIPGAPSLARVQELAALIEDVAHPFHTTEDDAPLRVGTETVMVVTLWLMPA